MIAANAHFIHKLPSSAYASFFLRHSFMSVMLIGGTFWTSSNLLFLTTGEVHAEVRKTVTIRADFFNILASFRELVSFAFD